MFRHLLSYSLHPYFNQTQQQYNALSTSKASLLQQLQSPLPLPRHPLQKESQTSYSIFTMIYIKWLSAISREAAILAKATGTLKALRHWAFWDITCFKCSQVLWEQKGFWDYSIVCLAFDLFFTIWKTLAISIRLYLVHFFEAVYTWVFSYKYQGQAGEMYDIDIRYVFYMLELEKSRYGSIIQLPRF